ncbi:MAG TPA: hypothetical protein VM618_08265 [Acidimicrobiia bacterium]|nr:hypothetical protein [Acidimicrobiia bacterium]
MNRSIGRRYLPLAAALGVQLLIIAVAPSEAPSTVDAAAVGDFTNGGTGDGTTDFGTGNNTSGTGGSDGSGGSSGSGGSGSGSGSGGAGGTTDGGGTGGGDGGGGTGQAAGDTSHCVNGRQFDPAIDFYAPPCVPKFTGQNPGATYQGVTGDTITLVRYDDAGNAAVNEILKASGSYVTADQYRQFFAVAEKFINDHYELYGRKVKIKVVEGNCETIPPDDDCLRPEMQQIVRDHKPYFVWWNTSLSSTSFEELSKTGTPNAGGWHFRDEYNQRLRPYHWDVSISGTRIAQHMGRWYCAQLHGKKAKYAMEDSLANRDRLLGVISTNDVQNQSTVEVDLKNELDKCGASFDNRTYFYAQDISTADSQRRAAVLRMRGSATTEADDATTVMCFCDLVAPIFLWQEEQTQSYYPENIVPGTGFMDRDSSAQPYSGDLGCPAPTQCPFDGAFGVMANSIEEPINNDAGTRVWKAGGGQGPTPWESGPLTREWDYLNMIATLIQAAGPNLNPATMEQGAFRLPPRGDATHVLRAFSPGNYAWNQDVQPVYWSPGTASKYNGESGAYVPVGGRVGVNAWRPGEFNLPAFPR